jgi:NADPH oxidase 2
MDYYFGADGAAYDDEKPTERARSTPLTRILMSGEVTMEKEQALTSKEKFDRWMINEGYRRLYARILLTF